MNTKSGAHAAVPETFLAEHATAALSEMRRLASLHDAATDDMLHAAMYMSIQPRPAHDRTSGFGLFNPPLHKLTASDVHEDTYIAEPHVSAVRRLVSQRGLTTIRLAGLQQALQA
jgi:hypothetical protein